MKFPVLQGFCLAAVALFAGSVQAQYQDCPVGFPRTTPSTDFFDLHDGTVLHFPTSLVWKRCSEGERWNGANCSDQIQTYSWTTALQRVEDVNAAATLSGTDADWRLPNVNELQSIVERGCARPSINLAIFPVTQGFAYWASSPFEKILGTFGKRDSAWLVGFYYGGVGGREDNWNETDGTYAQHPIRLVRSGHGAAPFDLLAPRAPTVISVVPGDKKITISFAASAIGPAASTFSASCTDEVGNTIRGVIGLSSPITVNNLTNGVRYTCSAMATNAQGSSLASASTNTVPQLTVPDAPTLLRLVSGNLRIRVYFAAPSSNGGSPITGYQATCVGSDAVPHLQNGPSSPIAVAGLANGLAYSCSVRAINLLGSSAPSAVASQFAKRPANLAPIISILLGD